MFEIEVSTDDFKTNGEIIINGELSIFVNCGSQYAIWYQFPETIQYTLKNIDTEDIFRSIDNERSISWNGNEVYDHYAKEPCNKIVTQRFSVFLKNIYFINPPENPIENFELTASYLGETSNSWTVNHVSVILTGF